MARTKPNTQNNTKHTEHNDAIDIQTQGLSTNLNKLLIQTKYAFSCKYTVMIHTVVINLISFLGIVFVDNINMILY